jgi:hypothetical protein
MSLSDGMFANAVMGTLREPAVNMVNFRVGTFGIGTMHYGTIAAMITSGAIKCKVDPSKLPTGAAAIWDNGTIYGARADSFYADEKQLFVHESTHAIIQMIAGVSPGGSLRVKNLNNEVAAYLGGALYVVASGQQASFRDPRSPISAAYKIALAKNLGTPPTNAGSPIGFSDAEIVPLIVAIKAMPLYSDWNQDPDLRRFW